MYHVHFARIAWSNQRFKNAVFCRNLLVLDFAEGKMYPAALHKIPSQTLDSSEVWAKCIRQKQPQKIKRITKNWDKNIITDLERFCPKQDHDLFSKF